MSSERSIRLRCEQCGHEWSARNTEGKGRQCSKCRSRRLIEVSEDATFSEVRPDVENAVEPKAATSNDVQDDLEIRQKAKELEMAKLEKQIRDLNGSSVSEGIAERMVANNILLLDILRRCEVLDESEYDMLASLCPWCGARGDEGLVYDDADGRNGNRCASCGHWVPY